jgi:hypothetical protein
MSLLVLFAVALMKIEHLWQFSDTLTPVRVYRLRQRVHPRPTGLVSAALPISAPSRLRVSRSDARGDAEHAERWRMRRLLSIACATLSNKTNLCENCNNS